MEHIVQVVPDSVKAKVILELGQKEIKKKKQVNPSKRWCFTANNYDNSHIAIIICKCSAISASYIIGKEVGEMGTPHLQGYIEFKKRIRPKGTINLDYIHWEQARGSRDENLAYCSKDGDFETNFKMPKPLILISEAAFYDWQLMLFQILTGRADNRTIYWYWEAIGNVGKSAFAKLMCARYDALIVSGKAADINCGIAGFKEEKGYFPDIIIVDCPRGNIRHMNYAAIEQVKNGLVFSGKYESKQLIFNPPHVVVFANEPPIRDMYSEDRWRVIELALCPRQASSPAVTEPVI